MNGKRAKQLRKIAKHLSQVEGEHYQAKETTVEIVGLDGSPVFEKRRAFFHSAGTNGSIQRNLRKISHHQRAVVFKSLLAEIASQQ
jgi:hypothetical protein